MISQIQIFEIKPSNPRRTELINEFKHKTQTKINKTNYNENKNLLFIRYFIRGGTRNYW